MGISLSRRPVNISARFATWSEQRSQAESAKQASLRRDPIMGRESSREGPTHLQGLFGSQDLTQTLAGLDTESVAEYANLLDIVRGPQGADVGFQVLGRVELKNLAFEGEDLVGCGCRCGCSHGFCESENEKLKAELESLKREQAKGAKDEWKKQVQNINGINALFVKTEMDNASIKDLVFQLKAEVENAFIVVANNYEGKATISVGIADDLVKGKDLHAGNLVREWAKEIKGGGSGQPVFATAGGKDPQGLDKVLQLAKEKIS